MVSLILAEIKIK